MKKIIAIVALVCMSAVLLNAAQNQEVKTRVLDLTTEAKNYEHGATYIYNVINRHLEFRKNIVFEIPFSDANVNYTGYAVFEFKQKVTTDNRFIELKVKTVDTYVDFPKAKIWVEEKSDYNEKMDTLDVFFQFKGQATPKRMRIMLKK
ncbi:hypothetical protein AAIR98_001506 [Elusimicrobium simillimum]|uniref:hypothetical protein n=1 Tax=Elusimicrobium simillimum TaxID=3143438 RepID=UPI003C6F1A35